MWILFRFVLCMSTKKKLNNSYGLVGVRDKSCNSYNVYYSLWKREKKCRLREETFQKKIEVKNNFS